METQTISAALLQDPCDLQIQLWIQNAERIHYTRFLISMWYRGTVIEINYRRKLTSDADPML